MRILIFCLFLLSPIYIFSQTVRTPISLSYTGLGAYSRKHVDVFSFQSNQASLAELDGTALALYGEKRFLLDQLGLYDAAFAVATKSFGNFGADIRFYGFNVYREGQIGLAYARQLGTKVDAGVQFNYYSVSIAGYGRAAAINFDVGVILHLTKDLTAGMHIYNPESSAMTPSEQEKLASSYSAGIGYEPSEQFFMSLEIAKEENKPVDVKAGFQYNFISQVMVRAGISTAESIMYLGIGFTWNMIRLDAVASYHDQLGITPGLLIVFNLKKQGK